MQDVGGKEDAEFSKDDLILGWREWLVESLGHCQPIRINFLCTGYSRLLAAGLSGKSVRHLIVSTLGIYRQFKSGLCNEAFIQ